MTWHPGESGNPNGKPKAAKAFADALRIAISEAHGEGGTKLRKLAEALVEKGITGDVPAIKEIADRLDGKVPQGIDADIVQKLTVGWKND